MAFISAAITAAGLGITTATGIATGAFITVGWGTILTAASVAYQITQANKARAAARAAADARKGYEMVVQGAAVALPIVYGRALIGGVRVWHKTSSIFKFAETTAQRTFSVGMDAVPGKTWPEEYTDPETGEIKTRTVTEGGREAGKLDRDWEGSRNDYLFFQQALCQGPIESVQDILINNGSNLDEPTYGNARYEGSEVKSVTAAMRIDCHYWGEMDPIAAANDYSRRDAVFSDAAYANVAIALDSNEAQFQGVPEIQFIIEGRTVGYFSGNNYSKSYNQSTKRWTGNMQYSTNPALCLLDYLLDSSCGKALTPSQVDMDSFRLAAEVCGKTVMSGAIVGGQIWNPVGIPEGETIRRISTRDIPLYECNIIVDTSKPIRENVESILSTMGDARLVWSQGKYKLLVQYPESNELIDLAGTLTDDDLVMDDQIDIKWPSSSERLNYATVKFHNESMDFKEDSVSWPPKKSGTFWRGLGSDIYPLVSGWEANDGGKLLNEYGVWSGTNSTSTLSWKFVIKQSGNHTLRFTADNSASVSISVGGTHLHEDWRTVKTVEFSATKDTVVTITATIGDDGEVKKGFAGIILDSVDMQVWTSRSPAYTDFIQITQSSGVYDAMLAEDNGVLLESDTFGEGITDYYHALAKAEELVRTSRTAFVISFKYQVKEKYFEPGDIIKLTSETLGFGDGIYIRINEATLEEGLFCRIVGARFDWTQLAWNVADDQYLKPKNPYNNTLAAPAWLTYSSETYRYTSSAGTLKWAEVPDARVAGYILYASPSGDNLANGAPNFFEVGRSEKPPFELPPLAFKNGIFGVRAVTASGIMSAMTRSDSGTLVVGKKPPTPELLTAVSSETKAEITLTFDWPANRGMIDTGELDAEGNPVMVPDVYDDHAVVTVWRSSTEERADAVNIGESSTKTYIDTDEAFRPVYYWVECVSLKGVNSDSSNMLSSEFNHFGGLNPDAEPPPAPYNLVVLGGYSHFKLTWTNPTHNIGGGHAYSMVYGAPGGEGTPFSEAMLIGKPTSPEFWFSISPGVTWTFWVKEVSKAGGVSLSAAGPVTASTAIDVALTIAAISGEINESVLAQSLKERIELIDASELTPGSVASKVKEARDAAAADLDAAQVLLDAADASLQSGITANTTAIGTVSTNLEAAKTALEGQLNVQGGAIAAVQTVNATQATQISGLSTRVGATESSITTLNTTTATQATSLTNLNTRTATNESNISTLFNTTEDQATSLTALTTRVGDAESNLSTLNTTTATQATNLTSLTTRTANSESAISALNTTTANQATSLTNLTTRTAAAESAISTINTTTASQATSLASLTTRTSAAESAISTLNTTTANQATSLNTLTTKVGDAESAISTLNTTTAAQATNLTTLNTKAGEAESAITALNTTTAAQATSLSSLSTRTGANESSIGTLNTTTASQATSLSNLTTRTAAAESAISTLNTTTANQATSISQVSLTATTANNTANTANSTANAANSAAASASASVQTLSTVVSGAGGLTAQYSVKLDVNGYVSGFGLYNEGSNSSFGVNADNFWVGKPGNTAYPFIVRGYASTINGKYVPAGVYMADAFIADGTITTAKIGDLQVDTGNIKDLAVHTLKINGNAVTVPMFAENWNCGWIGAGQQQNNTVVTPGQYFEAGASVLITLSVQVYSTDSTYVTANVYCQNPSTAFTAFTGLVNTTRPNETDIKTFTGHVTIPSSGTYALVAHMGNTWSSGSYRIDRIILSGVGAMK